MSWAPFWRVLILTAVFVLGWLLGRGRGATAYLIGGSDQRANWSRVTALVGIVCWVQIVTVVLSQLDVNGDNANDVLWILAGGTLAIMGINLGQYVTNTVKTIKQNGGASPVVAGAAPPRDSGLQAAPKG